MANYNGIEIDAIPPNTHEVTKHPELILNALTVIDYRSLFFLLIDVGIKKEDFLSYIKKERDFLKGKFLLIYYKRTFKDALLIEIFGTMQRYDLLKPLGTCSCVFKKDKETFTQLKSLWKFLYTVCEQLDDDKIGYLKEKLFFGNLNINVCCAEELICRAFVEGKLDENNWQSRLAGIFQSFHPRCTNMITSYKCSHLNFYPLRRPTKKAPCGIAVILNHVKFDVPHLNDRTASDIDASSLKKLWESFGFKTEIYTDLTSSEVLEVFQKLSKENHSNYDAFVACFLTHGDEGIVIAKDGIANRVADLVDLIANECETLFGKPKLFFVQACQGSKIQTGTRGPTMLSINNSEMEVLKIQSSSASAVPESGDSRIFARRSDVLIFNSSIEGFSSYRGKEGSWFIQALVSNMKECGEELKITEVLNRVGCEVTKKVGRISDTVIARCKQTPVRYDTLINELKLKKVLD